MYYLKILLHIVFGIYLPIFLAHCTVKYVIMNNDLDGVSLHNLS